MTNDPVCIYSRAGSVLRPETGKENKEHRISLSAGQAGGEQAENREIERLND